MSAQAEILSIGQLANKIGDVLASQERLVKILPILTNYKGKDWQQAKTFSKDCYERIELYRDAKFEIMLLCWEPGQASPIHNHAADGCAQVVLEGVLHEELFEKDSLKPISSLDLKVGDYSFIDDTKGVHRISNKGNYPCCSLHVYSPPGFVHEEF